MRNTSILLLALAAFSGNAFANCGTCKTEKNHKHETADKGCCPVDAAKTALKKAEKELVEAKKSGDKAAIEAAQTKVADAKKALTEAGKKASECTKDKKADKAA